MHRHKEEISGFQRGKGRRLGTVKIGEGGQLRGIEGNQTCSAYHSAVCTDVKL